MTYTISTFWATVLTVLIIWELVWKGIALWRAAQDDHLGWFILLLLINSAGILPIVYILLHKQHGAQLTAAHHAQP